MKTGLNKKIKKIIAVVLSVVIATGASVLFLNRGLVAEALFNADDAITYSTFKTSTTVDDAVLFIGTYIVHKDALTDQLYEKAMDSASDSGQNDIYYKSELSDGQWFNIGDVDNGVKGIADDGTPVPEVNIDPLYVTFYAGADGILRDAKTLLPVNPFDIPDPYDLSKLPELNPLWMQYTSSESADSISQEDFLKNRNSSDSGALRTDVYYYQLLSTFFSLDLRDSVTDECDRQLTGLNNVYISLKAAGEDEQAKVVFNLMEKVDAKRRYLVMERLAEADLNLLNTLYTLCTGSYYTPNGNFKTSSTDTETSTTDDPEYVTELKDSLEHDFTQSNQVLSPLISLWLSRLGIQTSSSGWWNVLDTAESDRRREAEEANSENEDYVFDESPDKSAFNSDSAILDAIGSCMSNCSDSYTTNLSKALTDKDDVLGHAEFEYSTAVIESSGGGTLGGPVEYLTHVINIQDNVVNDAAGELDLLNSSLVDLASGRYFGNSAAGVNADYAGLSSEAAKSSSLESQKDDLESDRSNLQFLIDAVRQRDTAANALSFVYERIDMTEAAKNNISDDDFKTYATSSLEAHIVWLKEEAQRIIDSDESLKSDADRLKDKKAELQAKRDGALDNNDLAGAAAYDALIAATDQDIAAAGGGGEGALADSLVDKAMDKLADNANADLSGIADALAGVGADDALDKLKDKAAASGASANTLKGINDAMASTDQQGMSPSADELLASLESLMGKSIDEMNEKELAVATATMSQFAKGGVSSAGEVAGMLTSRLQATDNKYAYRQYSSSEAVEYVNMRVLSDCSDYRYFYDANKATGTMTKGSRAYIFKRGTDQMYNDTSSSDPEQLNDSVVYEGEQFIGEEDSARYFSCSAEYIYDSQYAVCLTNAMQSSVDEYKASLEESFGGAQ